MIGVERKFEENMMVKIGIVENLRNKVEILDEEEMLEGEKKEKI